MSDAASKLDQTSGSISAVTDKATEVATRHLNDVGERLGDVYAKGADRAGDSLDELPATLSDASVAGGRWLRQSHRTIDRSVRKQPVEALLLAGALGYLAGWAVSRG